MTHTDSWAHLCVYRSNHQPAQLLSSPFPLTSLGTIAKISPTLLTLHAHTHTLSLPTHTGNPHQSQRNLKQTTVRPVTLPYWPWEQCCSVCSKWRKRSSRWSPPLSSLSLLFSSLFYFTLLLRHVIYNMLNVSIKFSPLFSCRSVFLSPTRCRGKRRQKTLESFVEKA